MPDNTPTPTAVVPGATPGTTPPFVASPDPSEQVREMTKRILTTLAQSSQQKKFSGTPHPSPVPGQQGMGNARSIGMNTGNPHAWGGQRFMAGLQTMIQNGVAKKKETEMLKAEGDWEYLQSALNEQYAAEASGDQKALASARAKVDAVAGDPKKLKNMAKALNQDWLNPEKTTVYGEALKRVNAKTQQTDQQKAQAKQGLMGLFRKLMTRGQQPQLNPDERSRMSQEITAKAPTASAGASVKDQTEAAKGILDIEKAAKEAREQYSVIASPDGTVWAYDKSNPKNAFQLRDTETGKEIKGKTAAKEGQTYSVNGIPVGVFHSGVPIMPGDAGWTARDQTMFDGAIQATKEKQLLRIDPIIASQLGEPPNPAEFKKGRSDPAYGAALKKYGQDAEGIKNRMSAASGEARAKAFAQYRVIEGMDYDEEGNPRNRFMYAKDAVENGFGSASQGSKNLSRTKQIEDIEFSSKKLREAVTNIDKPFSAAQIVKLETALKAPDETIAQAEMQALANSELTDKQQDFVLWVKHLNERAMSLRNIAGQGQGAQDTRDAIRALLPGASTGDAKLMLKMMDAFDNQTKILKSGIPKAGGQKRADEKKDQAKPDAAKPRVISLD